MTGREKEGAKSLLSSYSLSECLQTAGARPDWRKEREISSGSPMLIVKTHTFQQSFLLLRVSSRKLNEKLNLIRRKSNWDSNQCVDTECKHPEYLTHCTRTCVNNSVRSPIPLTTTTTKRDKLASQTQLARSIFWHYIAPFSLDKVLLY